MHDELLAAYNAARLANGELPLADKSVEELEALTLTLEQFGVITRALVEEVWRLRSVIAVRKEKDRVAEQIEQGYR